MSKQNNEAQPQTNNNPQPAQPAPQPAPAEPAVPLRQSKIAALPLDIRTQVNERLDRGEQGIDVVKFLNHLPEVRKHPSFPITAVNVSAWKHGPFRDWQRHRDFCVAVGLSNEQSGEFCEAAGNKSSMTEALASMLSIELTHFARHWLASAPDEQEKWKRLKELLRELAVLRRGDLQAARLAMEQDRRRAEVKEREEQEAKEAGNTKQFEGHAKDLNLQTEIASFVKSMKADMDREDFEQGKGEMKQWAELVREANKMPMDEAKAVLANREARIERERKEAAAAKAREEAAKGI